MKEKIICILVLYNPVENILQSNIEAVIDQVDYLWISDNTPGGFHGIQKLIAPQSQKIHYALMDGNVGIAKAQNAGIRFAIESNYDFVFFLDQDSISPEGLIDGLKKELLKLEEKGLKVGGVGPQPFNRDTGRPYLANISKGNIVKSNVREVDQLISSASLIRTYMFQDVGLMDEKLFIDCVDFELCWRAKFNAEYRFFMVTSLLLSHHLGEGDKCFLGISVKVPTPFRIYYQYRNYFYLVRRKSTPIYWSISNGVKFICKYFYYPLMCKNGSDYFRNINSGIWHGITHKIG